MTITYELDGSGGANSDCTPAVGNNKRALSTRVDSTACARKVPALTTDEISHAWTTEADNPNSDDWPSGDYKGSVNVATAPTEVSYKIQLLRVNSGCTAQETLGTSASLSGTGVKTYTATVDPSAGAAGDRYQIRLLGSNSHEHAGKNFDITIDADCYILGPWAPAIPDNTVYLVKSTGKRTQLSAGAVAIRIDPTTGKRSLDTSLTKFLVREDNGTLRAKSA